MHWFDLLVILATAFVVAFPGFSPFTHISSTELLYYFTRKARRRLYISWLRESFMSISPLFHDAFIWDEGRYFDIIIRCWSLLYISGSVSFILREPLLIILTLGYFSLALHWLSLWFMPPPTQFPRPSNYKQPVTNIASYWDISRGDFRNFRLFLISQYFNKHYSRDKGLCIPPTYQFMPIASAPRLFWMPRRRYRWATQQYFSFPQRTISTRLPQVISSCSLQSYWIFWKKARLWSKYYDSRHDTELPPFWIYDWLQRHGASRAACRGHVPTCLSLCERKRCRVIRGEDMFF
jgi:hypothetical protein